MCSKAGWPKRRTNRFSAVGTGNRGQINWPKGRTLVSMAKDAVVLVSVWAGKLGARVDGHCGRWALARGGQLGWARGSGGVGLWGLGCSAL